VSRVVNRSRQELGLHPLVPTASMGQQMPHRVEPVGLDLILHLERIIAIFRVIFWVELR
jgi:hypothetical protein